MEENFPKIEFVSSSKRKKLINRFENLFLIWNISQATCGA